ncbi:hypothetical protein B0H19DRAFT_1309914 [Mycena capillaripes]|nr:hypothetical protein B0H19DRAFT_1309914 [Mycena capillaripes]
MAKIFARSILLLSVVTTALSLFQYGIVSSDQHEIADGFTNLVQNINDIHDALHAVHSGSGFSDLMGASSVSATVEQVARVSLKEAREAIATGLSDFRGKANQLDEIYFGAVAEGCKYLKDFHGQFTTLASSCDRFDSDITNAVFQYLQEYRGEMEAARDAILSMLSETVDSTTCAGN